MNALVIYKSKYGSTKTYAEWIAEALECEYTDAKKIKVEDLGKYDVIIYGGGMYAEVINGVSFITKNISKLKEKKIVIFSTGITPLNCREYYDKLVTEKNFTPEILKYIKVYNFLGKMILNELSVVHRTAIKTLKKIMTAKEHPTDMEKLLIELCEADGDFTDKNAINDLINYVKTEDKK